MDNHLSAALIAAFGQATDALARAEERLALCPEPALLTTRIRLAEQEALAWLEGASFAPEQLTLDYGSGPRAWRNWPFVFVRAFDRPLPSPPRAKAPLTAAQVAAWLDPVADDALFPPGWRARPLLLGIDRLGAWERQARQAAALPGLIAAADLAAGFARAAPLREGNVVIGTMLAERHALPGSALTAGGIAALGLHAAQVPWRALVRGASEDELAATDEAARQVRCRQAWLDATTRGAELAIGLDKRLRLWLAQLERVCAGRRRSSHLRALSVHAGKVPAVTVSRAAQALGLSRQATTRLVAEACEAHLLREITRGNAFRRYVIAI